MNYAAAGLETAVDRQIVGNAYRRTDYIPEKEGYAFTGWYEDAGGNVPANEDFTVENRSYTFYAGFERIVRKGDVDGNGRINVADLKLLKTAFSTGDGDYIFNNSDLNGDGRINLRDIKLLQSLIASRISEDELYE